MRLIDVFDRLLAPKAPSNRAENRMVDPVVIGSLHQNQLFGLNLDELKPAHIRAAYRSIVQMLIAFRARNFAKHFEQLRVQGLTRAGTYEDVDPDHPWCLLLKHPNRHTPAGVTWNWMFQAIDAVGHADFIVEDHGLLGRRVPVALHPIYPEFGRVEPVFGGQGQIISWTFEMASGGIARLEARDIVRIKEPHPLAPWRTAGKIEAAAYEIDTLSAQNIFARDAARDQGKPRVMLEAQKELTRDTALTIARDFAATHRAGGATAVPISHSGLVIKPITITPRDLEFIEGQKFTKEQIFTIFEVSIAVFSGEAYATGRNAARLAFLENTAQPKVEAACAQMQFEFERIFEVRNMNEFRLVAPNVVPVDQKLQAEIDEIKLRSGLRNRNELRERDGLEAIPGGDVFTVPATLTPLELIAEGLQ